MARRERINGDALPSALLPGKAEELVLAALSVRLSERYLAERLGIGLRALRRSFLDERGVTAYVALRQLRLLGSAAAACDATGSDAQGSCRTMRLRSLRAFLARSRSLFRREAADASFDDTGSGCSDNAACFA